MYWGPSQRDCSSTHAWAGLIFKQKQTQENQSFLVCIHTYIRHACMHACTLRSHVVHSNAHVTCMAFPQQNKEKYEHACTHATHNFILKKRGKTRTHACMHARHKSEKNEFKIVKKHARTHASEQNKTNTSMHTGMRATHRSEKCVYKIIKRGKTRMHARKTPSSSWEI